MANNSLTTKEKMHHAIFCFIFSKSKRISLVGFPIGISPTIREVLFTLKSGIFSGYPVFCIFMTKDVIRFEYHVDHKYNKGKNLIETRLSRNPPIVIGPLLINCLMPQHLHSCIGIEDNCPESQSSVIFEPEKRNGS